MSGMRIFLTCVVVAGVLAAALWLGGPWWSEAPRERIGIPMNGKVEKTDEEWRKLLTDEQYRVTRRKGTERAFTGEYWNSKEPGVYRCVCCGQPLFNSDTKFDSGTGWPSFWQPVDKDN